MSKYFIKFTNANCLRLVFLVYRSKAVVLKLGSIETPGVKNNNNYCKIENNQPNIFSGLKMIPKQKKFLIFKWFFILTLC